jgi:hypothetical protein
MPEYMLPVEAQPGSSTSSSKFDWNNFVNKAAEILTGKKTGTTSQKVTEGIGGWISNVLGRVNIKTDVAVKIPAMVYVVVAGLISVLIFVTIGLFKKKKRR